MSILSIASALGSGVISRLTSQSTPLQKATQDFSDILHSLQAGNLPAAKKAFVDLQKQAPASASSVLSPIKQDLSTLSAAISAGNISQAQSAFSQFYLDSSGAGSELNVSG